MSIFPNCRFFRVIFSSSFSFSKILEMNWFLLLTSLLFIVASSQQCRSTYSVSGRYLKGHVILTRDAKDIGHCLILCSEDQRCNSTNFHFLNFSCELNDADRHTLPQDLEFKDGYTYSDYRSKVRVRRLKMLLYLL